MMPYLLKVLQAGIVVYLYIRTFFSLPCVYMLVSKKKKKLLRVLISSKNILITFYKTNKKVLDFWIVFIYFIKIISKLSL